MGSCNKTFMEYLIKNNDLIYMDTAALMETEPLNRMVLNYKDILMAMDKRIIIPSVVCQELVRHLTSDNEDKISKADYALKTIRTHGEIFAVESADYSSADLRKAFADRDLLLRLTRFRAKSRQLLITNDRKLSRDAYTLNHFESCGGKLISVCYLSNHGDLRQCDFYAEQPSAPTVKVIKEEIPVYIPIKDKKTDKKGKEILVWILTAVASYGAGYGSCKYGKAVLRGIKSMI